MVAFPTCKINLGLNIIRKREDRYHELETCFYPVPFTDILEIIPSDVLTFTSTGNAIPGNTHDNLCLKAYDLLQKEFNIGDVHIHLHKIIPTGAGLGGGSSDAASTLLLLNSIFDLTLSENELAAFASQLGSDCTFFIYEQAMLGTGRGEILRPLPVSLAGKYLVLVHPNIHVSTAEAFADIIPQQPSSPLSTLLLDNPLHEWRNVVMNDFEVSIFKKHPAIQSIKDSLYEAGALYASMSGSGSTVYGIFNEEIDVRKQLPAVLWSGYL